MGPALGYAVTLHPAQSLLVFSALGIGMAAPYVVLSFIPALLRFLPKPGAWMEGFKQFMAFPLLATVIWLTWVLSLQAGTGAVIQLQLGLLLLGFGAWLYGRWSVPSQTPVWRTLGTLAGRRRSRTARAGSADGCGRAPRSRRG